jgi:hypothetical protein
MAKILVAARIESVGLAKANQSGQQVHDLRHLILHSVPQTVAILTRLTVGRARGGTALFERARR